MKNAKISEAALEIQRRGNEQIEPYSKMLLYTNFIKNADDPDVVEEKKIIWNADLL